MGALKVVIDTNVVISGLLFGGTPGKLIPLWQKRAIRPMASKQIIDEYLQVLTYPRFKLDEAEINFILYREILPYFDITEAPSKKRVIAEDPADDKFIHCALSGKATHIISGDKHLLALKDYHDIKILSPSEFLKTNFY
jgi:putative PIN family toxin of toxin-antitoxin system